MAAEVHVPGPDPRPAADPAPQRAAHPSLAAAWRARVAAAPDRVALAWFDARLSAAEVDEASDALAVAFARLGCGPGDRVGIHLQNVPHHVFAVLALWKLGAIVLPLNPMYRRAELRRLVDDAEAVGILCADHEVDEVAESLAGSSVRWTLSSRARDLQSRDDPRVFAPGGPEAPGAAHRPAAQGDLGALLRRHRGERPDPVDVAPDDVALLTYTSGTTGPPKGAMSTHANVLSVVDTFGDWVGLAPGDVVLAMAPLFHITGAVVNAALSLLTDTTLVLTGRFHPEVALEAFVEHGVTFTIGSITAYSAMAQVPHASREHFASATGLWSGGAPIPPATVERFEARFGVHLHNAYGMTETTSAVVAVPAGRRAPVHGPSGTLSVGVPLPGVTVRVVDPEGRPVPTGEQGELEMSGPSVVAGYWRNPEATEHTMPGGRLRSGDVAVLDDDGWVYLVDRLKDQVNVSGYKVWPREVEDALYEHPAVREAAVVGEPDAHRGESVLAFVSLVAGAQVAPEELIAFARERLAAYKAPRRLVVLDDLPKTQTGKIRRNVLREGAADAATAPAAGPTPSSGGG
ncbi:class I adenylate-forming enzyme family protein [Nocardioides perillae]|uniref:class I adenylate-forming enzyme family protein n=1 Tax=Nocardioides perillae TaxID=1119534 RepID=UPI001C5411C9